MAWISTLEEKRCDSQSEDSKVAFGDIFINKRKLGIKSRVLIGLHIRPRKEFSVFGIKIAQRNNRHKLSVSDNNLTRCIKASDQHYPGSRWQIFLSMPRRYSSNICKQILVLPDYTFVCPRSLLCHSQLLSKAERNLPDKVETKKKDPSLSPPRIDQVQNVHDTAVFTCHLFISPSSSCM